MIKNNTRSLIMTLLLPLALIPVIAATTGAQEADVIYDDHIMYNLNNLIQKGNYSTENNGIRYVFNTTLSEDGWYTSNITTINHTESDTTSLKFRPNTDGTYSLISTDANIDTRVSSTGFTGASRISDPPEEITKSVSDTGNDPYALKDSTTQNCLLWNNEWSVESSRSKYIDKVHIKWKGEDSFRYWCLFPYDIKSTTINYEGQERTNTSAEENFNLGSPPYLVAVKWTYSSAT